MKSLAHFVRAPMDKGVQLNRDWMVRILRGFQGRLLELGPGDAPLLAEVPDDDLHEKWVVEFPGVIEHSRRLGYRCLEQNLGTDVWNIEDQSMDVIVSCQVLEHIPNVDHVMS